jgi:hypothetical protein
VLVARPERTVGGDDFRSVVADIADAHDDLVGDVQSPGP